MTFCLTAPYSPLPQWRKEFGNSYVLRDFDQLQSRVQSAVDAWPRELASPLLKKFDGEWNKVVKPTFGHKDFNALTEAVQFAEGIACELDHLKLNKVSGDVELCELADRNAKLCELYPAAAEFIVQRIGLEVPDGKGMTDEGRLLRMQDVRWWRRNLRRIFGQAVENAMRSRGLVCKGRAPYCTDWALRRRTSQKQRTRTMLQEAVAINEDGQQFELFNLVQRSVSNPAIRRAELMTRIRGFEEIATECGYICLFITFTAPSCYHAQHSGGGENQLYVAAGKPSVRLAQQWLCRIWARARAKLARLCIEIFGFRIAEPHHDGTPHWHGLLFVKPSQLGEQLKSWKPRSLSRYEAGSLRDVLYRTWLSEHANERGAEKHRINFKKINPYQGSAAGYIAKYVAKNIDGFEVGTDNEAGGEATTTAHRVDAWASTHRIRQFQQIGGAPVGLWRELRRCRSVNSVELIEAARLCADAGDWKGFNQHAHALSLYKETTGECNAYREVKQPCVVGVQSGSHTVRTRIHEWSIKWGTGTNGIYLERKGDAGAALLAKSVTVIESRLNKQDGFSPVNQRSDLRGDAFRSDSGASRPLGLVSITVRGDGLMIYPHGERWLLHRAISIPKPKPVEIDPRYKHLYTIPYREQHESHRTRKKIVT